MSFILLAFVIGVVAGMRTMTAPTAISWAARLGHLHLDHSWLAFFRDTWTPWIFTIAAIGELITDQLPMTPSRKTPPQFIARILSGALCGGAIGASAATSGASVWIGVAIGIAGAVCGTLGGAAARAWLDRAVGNDHPIAFLEDALAIAAAFLVFHLVV